MKPVQLRILTRITLTVLGAGCLWVTGLTDDLFALRARQHRSGGQRLSRANPRDGDHAHDFDLIRADCPSQLLAQHLVSYRAHSVSDSAEVIVAPAPDLRVLAVLAICQPQTPSTEPSTAASPRAPPFLSAA